MVGNKIGEGREEMAFEYGRRFAIMGVVSMLIGGAIIYFIREPVISLYELSPSASDNLRKLMLVYACSVLVARLQLYALHRRIARGW